MLCHSVFFQSYHTGIEIRVRGVRVQGQHRFQSYHTGIEIRYTSRGRTVVPAFNRTILELKYANTAVIRDGYGTFNRTILELKFLLVSCVLLVVYFQSYHTGIEIEYFPRPFTVGIAFNRTILELKYLKSFGKSGSVTTFQSYHTGIEMYVVGTSEGWVLLSIVPYWNWNEVFVGFGSTALHFQSYHTGIEIHKSIGNSKQYAFFQSYHTGIEIYNRSFKQRRQALSIVPYWNWNESWRGLADPGAGLSIVPYWNWNSTSPPYSAQATNFQSYHTGIEITKELVKLREDHAFNRTILELKWIQRRENGNQGHTFNRTILELKWVCVGTDRYNYWLSIVPYWNWNSAHTHTKSQITDSFNRTILELKCIEHASYHPVLLPFNRTILELKWTFRNDFVASNFLSIVPYWNWNSLEKSSYC